MKGQPVKWKDSKSKTDKENTFYTTHNNLYKSLL